MKKVVGLMAMLLLVAGVGQAQQEKTKTKEAPEREAVEVEKRVHVIRGSEADEDEMKWHTDDDRVIILKKGDEDPEAEEVELTVDVEGQDDGTRVIVIRKVVDGEKRIIKVKTKGDEELPDEVRELLEREGIDLVWLDEGEDDDIDFEFEEDMDEDRDRPMLGVMVGELEVEDADEVYEGGEAGAGVAVLDVVDGSPAEAAGLREGDVIVALDGQPVKDYRELVERLATHEAGDTVHLAWLRDGQRMEADVTLAEGEALELEEREVEEHRVIRHRAHHDDDGHGKPKKKIRKIIIIEEEH